jgi:hypothetical protein
MTALDPTGPAPAMREPRFLGLLFGCSAAPLFWLAQVILGYAVTAYLCYPGDHPVSLSATMPLFAALIALDIIALLACAAGALVSWRGWRRVRPAGRNRFLALWGLMSSLWFFVAVMFNVIASLIVPLCVA